MSRKALGLGTTALFMIFLSGCGPLMLGQDDSQKERADSLQSELATTKDLLFQEQKAHQESQKQRARMISCNRDFRGSYGMLIRREVELVRKTARVVRRDCGGRVVSDRKETVSPPREELSLPELKSLRGTDAEIITLNRQTCEGGGLYMGVRVLKDPFLWLDRANAVLTHEVFSGLNTIDFGLCDKTGQSEGVSTDCTKPTWVASLELVVHDPEIQENEIQEVKAQDCPK